MPPVEESEGKQTAPARWVVSFAVRPRSALVRSRSSKAQVDAGLECLLHSSQQTSPPSMHLLRPLHAHHPGRDCALLSCALARWALLCYWSGVEAIAATASLARCYWAREEPVDSLAAGGRGCAA